MNVSLSFENELKILFENIEDGISLMDSDSNILYQSPAADRITGYSFEERKSNPVLGSVHPDDLEMVQKIFDQVLRSPGKTFYVESRKLHKAGHYVWVEGTLTNLLHKEGVNGIVANFRDITKRKEVEHARLESEKKYRELFETMLDGVYKSTHEGKFLEANPALIKMLGYDSKEELLAIDIKSELYFKESDRDTTILQDQSDGIEIFRLRKKDGSEIWVEDHSQYVSDENGNVIYHEGILRDVTKRVQTERQLVLSRKETDANERKFRSLIENSADMISMMDSNGKFIYVSPEVLKKFGYTLEECLAMDTMDVIHSDDAEKLQVFFGELMKNPAVPLPGPVIRNKRKNGTYFWVEGTITNLLHLDGVNAIVANFRDITERKEQQDALENSNKELRKSNLELDKFVYSVSHDLRAPLLSMKGIVGIVAEETREEMTGELMQMLNGSITRLDSFISEILDYSRNARSDLKKETINFKEMLKNITNDLKHSGSENKPVEIHMEIKESGKFFSDKGRLSMILNNLISNSIRYHNPKTETPFVKIHINSNDSLTQIDVEDNGIGISKENQSKVFDMFYRVSENSIGSGLGLYIVKETIYKLKGDIALESQPGMGTKFRLKIPALFC